MYNGTHSLTQLLKAKAGSRHLRSAVLITMCLTMNHSSRI
ncbi:hypothetical protein MP638_002115 [Amoeboaphelidium occidentale]|nr:hypothetical protein MP638_002115 [Amoeboaphelidium occidentale]